jgi:hypothetical protein
MDWFDTDSWKDPQQQRQYCMCCMCGREIYRPFQETCNICRMDMEEDDGD